MTHTQHSAPNALMRQVRAERRMVAEAWQFGFFCGAFLAGAFSIIVLVPFALWLADALR